MTLTARIEEWLERVKGRGDEADDLIQDACALFFDIQVMTPVATDAEIGDRLRIVTGCCHFNDNGWCIDHTGGRHTSNFCSKAHQMAARP